MSRFGSIDPLAWLLPGFMRSGLDEARVEVTVLQPPGCGEFGAEVSLDFTGQTCLRTNLVTKRLLGSMRPGLVVEILSDNLSAVETIPFMLASHDCVHLATVHLDGSWKIYARKRSR